MRESAGRFALWPTEWPLGAAGLALSLRRGQERH
jgi:hypothetical protein